METKSSNKLTTYHCVKCEYITLRKNNWIKHIDTVKHNLFDDCDVENVENVANVSDIVDIIDVANVANVSHVANYNVFTCDKCSNVYKSRNGLWKHKKNCNAQDIKPVESSALTSIVIDLIKSNQELQQQMLEILSEAKNNGTTNNCNNNTIIDNKSFNLQFYLNTTCKDAINLQDFIDSIDINLTDVESIGKLGFVNGISNIIIQRLKALEIHKRPICCTDPKRDTMYIKEKNEWTKEEDNQKRIRRFIQAVANKNTRGIKLFKDKHPDCDETRSRYNNQYDQIYIEVFGGGKPDNESEDKIIRKLINEITVIK